MSHLDCSDGIHVRGCGHLPDDLKISFSDIGAEVNRIKSMDEKVSTVIVPSTFHERLKEVLVSVEGEPFSQLYGIRVRASKYVPPWAIVFQDSDGEVLGVMDTRAKEK